jgi:demethylmenaquinone methyltransferase / 2-methoxy-6-polyprenyl-1,4-benzoquinol methylase
MEEKTQTHFGFKHVEWHEKKHKVADVFNSVANKYDLMNDLMSLGIHRLWKKVALQKIAAKPGDYILDLAGGTGDLSLALSKKVGKSGKVILADINQSMLQLGRDKLINHGFVAEISYLLGDAENLPLTSNSLDSIVIAYGLRNVTDKSAALREMYRVLKPGGKTVILEFSKVENVNLEKIYDFYSFKILPTLGKIILNDADSYKYLAESIKMHPNQEELKLLMQHADFEECSYQNLSFGITAIHTGYKF